MCETMTRKLLLRRKAAEYLKNNDMMPLERQELLAWIKDGNSVYDNPWLLYEEQGYLMDYLTAMRAEKELRMQHFNQLNETLKH